MQQLKGDLHATYVQYSICIQSLLKLFAPWKNSERLKFHFIPCRYKTVRGVVQIAYPLTYNITELNIDSVIFTSNYAMESLFDLMTRQRYRDGIIDARFITPNGVQYFYKKLYSRWACSLLVFKKKDISLSSDATTGLQTPL